MILSRYRFWASVTDRYGPLRTVTERYQALPTLPALLALPTLLNVTSVTNVTYTLFDGILYSVVRKYM
jgi:hypothetical protein